MFRIEHGRRYTIGTAGGKHWGGLRQVDRMGVYGPEQPLVLLPLTLERLYRLRYLRRGTHAPISAITLVRRLRLSLGQPASCPQVFVVRLARTREVFQNTRLLQISGGRAR